MSFLKNYFNLASLMPTAEALPQPEPEPEMTPICYKPGSTCKPMNKTTETDPVRALPASWYISPELYELERRAIFSKQWLLSTHVTSLPNPGDWRRYEISGFYYVLCRDSNGDIRSFHVAEDIEDFDIHTHGVFPIHVHIDCRNFIWINLDGGETPETSWEEQNGGADSQERLEMYPWDAYEYNHTWEMDLAVNWKLLGDNYNECYHCRIAHPDLRNLTDIQTYVVDPHKGYLMHYGTPTEEMIEKGLLIAPTYFFPNSSINVSKHFFMIQRFIPTSMGSSRMRYEVYKSKHATQEEFTFVDELYKRVMSEDKGLALGSQRNIERGVFINGELHPAMEKGALWFQSNVRDAVVEHHDREMAAGYEIWPTQQSAAKLAAAAAVAVEEDPAVQLESNVESTLRQAIFV